jgi:hypothetical protein
MSDPAEAALEWIRTSIREERPHMHPNEAALLALTLDAIAEDYAVPIEECIRWIHGDAFDQNPESWRDHCRRYADLRKRLCEAS